MIKTVLRQYLAAAAAASAVMAGFVLYLSLRIGAFSPSLANKALAGTSIVLIGIVLLLGPFSRLYDVFDRFLNLRKELGILAFVIGGVHVYLTMFPLARHGAFGFYRGRPWSAYPGLLGLVIMALLFIISFQKFQEKLGASRWWRLQYTGVRITGAALVMHMSVLKYSEWARWFSGGGGNVAAPPLPPESLLVALFAVFVFLVRLSEFPA